MSQIARDQLEQDRPPSAVPKIVKPSLHDGLHEPAGFGIRFLAVLLDGILLSLPLKGTEALINRVVPLDAPGDAKNYLIVLQLSVWVFYYVLPLCAFGKTLGKHLLGLQVLNADGSEGLSFAKAVWRESVGKTISFFSIYGSLLVIYRSDRKGLHDLLSKTQVVKKSES